MDSQKVMKSFYTVWLWEYSTWKANKELGGYSRNMSSELVEFSVTVSTSLLLHSPQRTPMKLPCKEIANF